MCVGRGRGRHSAILLSLPLPFSLQTEHPEEVRGTQRVWKPEQDAARGGGVVPAAPNSPPRSPGHALSAPGQHVPVRPVLPARWPSCMDSCSKLSPVNRETHPVVSDDTEAA